MRRVTDHGPTAKLLLAVGGVTAETSPERARELLVALAEYQVTFGSAVRANPDLSSVFDALEAGAYAALGEAVDPDVGRAVSDRLRTPKDLLDAAHTARERAARSMDVKRAAAGLEAAVYEVGAALAERLDVLLGALPDAKIPPFPYSASERDADK